MKTMINEILQLLTASQDELFDSLENRLQTYGYTTQKTAYALGAKSQEAYAPTVVAHLDTRNINTLPTRDDIKVTDEWIGLSEEANDALDCLGADDRAGVASILILLDKGYRPNVLFTRDDKSGLF
ncbi:hypothetical protein [Streptococcus sp. zg-JUN1979]|uniref:hypothetical protein n=1 Tax=Streptococcus sp. zg-JUN1979 TaxID=3391450 RepID=UPI0039A42FFF